MKYTDYLCAPNTRTMSTVMGVMIGVTNGLFWGWQIGVIFGAASAIVLTFVISFLVYRVDAPYAKIKERLQKTFLIDERVQFAVSGGVATGCMLLTDEHIILLAIEKGTEHRLELSREQVREIRLADRATLRISLDEKQTVRIMTGAAVAMLGVLRENGWRVNDLHETK